MYTNTTVRELAVQIPAATRIFEGLKIDYCCGGAQTLEEACTAAGVPVSKVEQLLEDAKKATTDREAIDFRNTSLTALIEHIVSTHHVFTKNEMARLETLIDKVCAAHAQNHPELLRVKVVLAALCADLKPHMFKEEQILFPYILMLETAASKREAPVTPPFGTVANPVRMMMLEHDTVGELLRDLRVASSNYAVPADACISYKTLYEAFEAFEQDLHQHIHLENNILFPRAVELENAARRGGSGPGDAAC